MAFNKASFMHDFDKLFDVDAIPYICKVAKNFENILSEDDVQNASNPMEAIKNISSKLFHMPIDVFSDATSYTVNVTVAGVPKSAVKVLVTGKNTISISYDRVDGERDDVVYHYKEIPRGSFSRVIQFQSDVDMETIKATQVDGVLQVNVKKMNPAKNVRQVPIS